jgi:hypothetical protein
MVFPLPIGWFKSNQALLSGMKITHIPLYAQKVAFVTSGGWFILA